MNNELMEQCRREAEEAWDDSRLKSMIFIHPATFKQGYAAALYAERSKRRELTDEHYRIIADRMVEEHRKYGDHLRHGHWAEIAARKVASHLADFGYLSTGLTVEVAEQAVKEWCLDWCERVAPDATDWNYLRARLTEAAKH